jgi:LmbE family N-acetylglucosaminyl deacetylase
MLVRLHHPEWTWFAYEDHGYKHIPGLLAWRVSKLFRSGTWPTPALVPVVADSERKRRAIMCYTSQIPPLERDHALSERLDANVPEQFWRIAPPPPGWEGLMDI